MLKTIREILKHGDATIQYPFAPLERPPYARGKPEHDLTACIACAACAVACPPNAIQMVVDPKAATVTWSINYGRCVFCGRCEEVCPTKAIVLGPEFELAVFDKNDLEQTCTYPLQRCQECGRPFASAKEVDYVLRVLQAQEACAAGARGTGGDGGPGQEAAPTAIDYLRVCPACRQRADAYRAKRRVEALGDPTPEPTSEQMEQARRLAAQRKGGVSL